MHPLGSSSLEPSSNRASNHHKLLSFPLSCCTVHLLRTIRDPTTAGTLISAFLEAAKGELNPQPLPPSPPKAIAPIGPRPSGSTAVDGRYGPHSAVLPPGVPQTHTVEEQRSQRRTRRDFDDAGEDGFVSAGSAADSDGGSLSNREGYDPKFLGRRVMLPMLSSWATESFGNPFVLQSTGQD